MKVAAAKHILSFSSEENAKAAQTYIAHLFGLPLEIFHFTADEWGTDLTFITHEDLAPPLRGRLIQILQPDGVQFNLIEWVELSDLPEEV